MRPVSRAEFARIAGVSSAAITNAAKRKLAPACVADRIDLDHPAARKYLGKRGRTAPPELVDPEPPDDDDTSEDLDADADADLTDPEDSDDPDPNEPTWRRRHSTRSSEVPIEFTAEFYKYADLSLREVVEKFGAIRGLKDSVDALKKIEDTRGRRLANDELEGHLVSREAVKTHIVGAMHSAFERLLRDAPRTVVARVGPMAKAGETTEEQERVARELIGSILKPALDTASRVVRNLAKQ